MLRTALGGGSPSRPDGIELRGSARDCTAVGDPIEAAALGAVLSEALPPGRFCPIGSVKTNLGHLEAASGVGGPDQDRAGDPASHHSRISAL